MPACGRPARSRRARCAPTTTSPTPTRRGRAERQEEHLRDFNYGALWAISIHEVYPGHFLHYQHLRQIESTLRKSILFAPTVDGRGLGALRRADDGGGGVPPAGSRHPARAARRGAHPSRAASSSASGCTAEDLSVEQGVRFFRDEAYLEEASARREAERGTFDPSYVVYALGKLMVLKLREDDKAAAGRGVLAAGFHDALLGNGTVPLWLHRQLMLGENNGTDARVGTTMPLYEYRVRRLRTAVSRDPEILRSAARRLSALRQGPGRKLLSSPAIQFKGSGLYITDYAEEGPRRVRGGEVERRQTAGGGERARSRVDTKSESPSRRGEESQARQAQRATIHRLEDRVQSGSRPRAAPYGRIRRACRRPSVAQVVRERPGEIGPLAARSTPPPSGTRACCRCRGGRRRLRRRRSAASCSSSRRPLVSWISPVRSLFARSPRARGRCPA